MKEEVQAIEKKSALFWVSVLFAQLFQLLYLSINALTDNRARAQTHTHARTHARTHAGYHARACMRTNNYCKWGGVMRKFISNLKRQFCSLQVSLCSDYDKIVTAGLLPCRVIGLSRRTHCWTIAQKKQKKTNDIVAIQSSWYVLYHL